MHKLDTSYSLIILLGLALFPSISRATDCTKTTDCTAMGYTKSASDCSGKNMVKCPSDSSKVFCFKETSELTIPCEVGAILYGDGKCYDSSTAPSQIKPVGVVFDGTFKLAVALTDVTATGVAGSEQMPWANIQQDIPSLENCTAEAGQPSKGNIMAFCGLDGKNNTDLILASNIGSLHAAKATNLYQSGNCSTDFCQKGKWFLPSIRELSSIYQSKNAIQNTLGSLSSFGATKLQDNIYWSSTEYDSTSVWILAMNNGSRSKLTKTGINYKGYYVRPVVKY